MTKNKNTMVIKVANNKIESLVFSRNVLLEYVYEKLSSDDLHGAIDGLMDMRDIDSELKQIDSMKRICESL